MTIVSIDRVKGSVHDLNKLLALPSTDQRILIVSSRTLSLLADFADYEVNWPTRYFTDQIDGGLVKIVERDSTDHTSVEAIAQQFRVEVIDMSATVIEAIDNLTAAVTALNAIVQGIQDNQPDPTDLDDLELILDSINEVLGGASVVP